MSSSLVERAASKAAEVLFQSFTPAPSAGTSEFHIRNQPVPSLPGLHVEPPSFLSGWASAAWSKPVQRKSKRAVAWLQDLFEKGEQTGQKVNLAFLSFVILKDCRCRPSRRKRRL